MEFEIVETKSLHPQLHPESRAENLRRRLEKMRVGDDLVVGREYGVVAHYAARTAGVFIRVKCEGAIYRIRHAGVRGLNRKPAPIAKRADELNQEYPLHRLAIRLSELGNDVCFELSYTSAIPYESAREFVYRAARLAGVRVTTRKGDGRMLIWRAL